MLLFIELWIVIRISFTAFEFFDFAQKTGDCGDGDDQKNRRTDEDVKNHRSVLH